jgi:hypothetical protein
MAQDSRPTYPISSKSTTLRVGGALVGGDCALVITGDTRPRVDFLPAVDYAFRGGFLLTVSP